MSEKSEGERISDPGLFRELSQPFASIEEANAAVEAFNTELRALRQKHRILNVVAVIQGFHMNGDREQNFMLDIQHGDRMYAESMFAWGFGRAQAARQQMIHDMMAASPVIQSPKKGK